MTTRDNLLVSLDTEGGRLPTRVRLFSRGAFRTKKGTFLFDDAAAASVMADYHGHGGIKLHFDYAHAALDAASRVEDKRAAGWFALSVEHGELWAVDVEWTPAAAAALRAKEWRFISPAFTCDATTKQVRTLLNVALTNMPATVGALPLIAASMGHGSAVTLEAQAASVGVRLPPEGQLRAVHMSAEEYVEAEAELVAAGLLKPAKGTTFTDPFVTLQAEARSSGVALPSRAVLARFGMTPGEYIETERELVAQGLLRPAGARR